MRPDEKFSVRVINWDKHNKEADPDGDNKWVKLKTRMLHNPGIFELTVEQRWLFIALLLHAGRVGAAFTLTPSWCRIAFGLRRGWRPIADFEALENQGLVSVDWHIEERREEEKREEENNTVRSEPSAPKAVVVKLPNRFEEWWKLYPKKVGKKPCQTKWKARKLDRLADTLIADVLNRIDHDDQWKRGFAPHPATYLNQDRWDDEIQKQPTQSQELLSGLKQFDDAERAKEAENG